MNRAAPLLRQFYCLAAAVALLFIAGQGARAAPPAPIDYTQPETWLCRPGRASACTADVTATVLGSSRRRTLDNTRPDLNAPIDCFYVYPTVSRERRGNSDMIAGAEERQIAREQVARFASKCRIYAPLYRQITVASLKGEERGNLSAIDPILGSGDVVDAFNSYLAHDNHGRGIVFIGHSQGAAILKSIIAVLIDRSPLQSRLVSAIIPGTIIDVLAGQGVGGTFAAIPLCQAATDIGCVISYSSFLARDPPTEASRFGRGTRPVMRDACVNPAFLETGRDELDALLPTSFGKVTRRRIQTPFVKVPGLLKAACVTNGIFTYLSVSEREDPRTPNLHAYLDGVNSSAGWGLHALDINLALGNLVDLVGIETKAWIARHGPVDTGP